MIDDNIKRLIKKYAPSFLTESKASVIAQRAKRVLKDVDGCKVLTYADWFNNQRLFATNTLKKVTEKMINQAYFMAREKVAKDKALADGKGNKAHKAFLIGGDAMFNSETYFNLTATISFSYNDRKDQLTLYCHPGLYDLLHTAVSEGVEIKDRMVNNNTGNLNLTEFRAKIKKSIESAKSSYQSNFEPDKNVIVDAMLDKIEMCEEAIKSYSTKRNKDKNDEADIKRQQNIIKICEEYIDGNSDKVVFGKPTANFASEMNKACEFILNVFVGCLHSVWKDLNNMTSQAMPGYIAWQMAAGKIDKDVAKDALDLWLNNPTKYPFRLTKNDTDELIASARNPNKQPQ